MDMQQQDGQQRIQVSRGNNFSSPGGGMSGMVRSAHSQGASLQNQEKQMQQEKQFAKAKKAVVIFDWLITISIAALFFGLPLFFTGLTFQGLAFEKQMYFYFWILLALVSWASKGVILGEMKIRRTPLDFPIIIFWVLYLISTIFSVDKWHSLWGFFGDPSRGLLSITAIIVAFYIILSHFDKSRMKWAIGGAIVANVIVAVWSLLGLLGVKFLPQGLMELAPLSLVGSVIGLGIYFSLMIPIITAVVIKDNKEGKAKGKLAVASKVILLLLLLLNLFLLLAVYSFNPWLGILIGVSLMLIFVLSQIVRPAEQLIWVPMAVFVGVLSILMIGTNKITKVNLPVEASPSYALSWTVAKSGVMEKFFTGSGPATYGYDFSKFKSQEFNQNSLYNIKFYQGTGVIMEALPTLGALGTIALAVILLSFVSFGIYYLTKDKQYNKLMSLGLFASALIVLIDGVTNRVEGTILIYGALIGTLALGMFFMEGASEGKFLNLSLKASPKFALALAFVFMVVSAGVVFLFVFIGKAYYADILMQRAATQKEIREDGSVAEMIRAINLYNKEGRYFTRVGQDYMTLFNNEALKDEKDRNTDLLQKYLNNSIALATRGSEMMKKDVSAIEILAQIYENAGLYVPDSITFAQKNYEAARELDPQNPNYFVKLGQLKVSEASKKTSEADKKASVGQAKELFQQSVEKKDNFSFGYYQLSLAQDALGDKDMAIENMKKAFLLERSNINYAFSLAKMFQARGNEEDMKLAEDLFKQILGINDKEINTHFSLGMLYEKQKKKNEAIDEYKKVLDLLPSSGSEETRKQINKMISNIQAGIENTPENLGLTSSTEKQAQPQQ